MRTTIAVVAGLAFGLLFLSAPRTADASVSVGVSVGLFHDELAPYGNWVRSARFGLVWTPRHVAPGWRPYVYGHWAYTDYDWTWVSDEDWGWATYHYGRWYFDPDRGWLWVPGDQWAPAWVAWRSDDDYVGWAPLPPDVDAFRVGGGFVIDPFAFSFVRVGSFCDPYVYRHFEPLSRNVRFWRATRDVTRYSFDGRRVLNRGIDIHRVERIIRHAVPRERVRDVRSPGEARGARIRGGDVTTFRAPTSTSRGRAADVRGFEGERFRPTTRRQEPERSASRPSPDQGRVRPRAEPRSRVLRPEPRGPRPEVAARPRAERRFEPQARSERATGRSGGRSQASSSNRRAQPRRSERDNHPRAAQGRREHH
jgi:Family of unknown function (DUF6600)